MLTVHHLKMSQSERIPWLCEELEIPYELVLHTRDPIFAPQSIKDLHPIGAAPIIQDEDLTLAETGACARYIIHKYGAGKLDLSPDHKDYATYLYWYHFVADSLQPGTLRVGGMIAAGIDQSAPSFKFARGRRDGYLKHLEARLEARTWLVGDTFTLADIMSVSCLTTLRAFYALDLSAYPNILSYLKRLTDRPAYKRARGKADPEEPLAIDGPPPTPFSARLKK